MKKESGFSTVYEAPDAGTVAFDNRADIVEEVDTYLQVIDQLKKDFKSKIESAGYPQKRDRNRGRYYAGIKIKPSYEHAKWGGY